MSRHLHARRWGHRRQPPPSIVFGQSQSPSGCGSFTIFIADETVAGSRSYSPRALTTFLTANSLSARSDMAALTAGGLTMVVISGDQKSFLSTQRSALQAIDFAAVRASSRDFDGSGARTLRGRVGVPGDTPSPAALGDSQSSGRISRFPVLASMARPLRLPPAKSRPFTVNRH